MGPYSQSLIGHMPIVNKKEKHTKKMLLCTCTFDSMGPLT